MFTFTVVRHELRECVWFKATKQNAVITRATEDATSLQGLDDSEQLGDNIIEANQLVRDDEFASSNLTSNRKHV